MHKAFKVCTAVLLALVMTVSLVSGALAVAVRNDDDTISYEPLEQGVYSKGGYTIDKVSHPTLGAGEVDGILTGDLQDRGQSYSWSMAEAGDYVYIGTCYNSTYYIYHNNVKTSLDAMKKEGKLDQNVDTSRAAADFVKVMFGTDTFDETPMSQWTPVIMAVNRYTGEAQVIFRERDILKDYPDIFPGYPPYLKGVNYLPAIAWPLNSRARSISQVWAAPQPPSSRWTPRPTSAPSPITTSTTPRACPTAFTACWCLTTRSICAWPRTTTTARVPPAASSWPAPIPPRV